MKAQEILKEYGKKCQKIKELKELAETAEEIRHEKALKKITGNYWKLRDGIESWYNLIEATE